MYQVLTVVLLLYCITSFSYSCCTVLCCVLLYWTVLMYCTTTQYCHVPGTVLLLYVLLYCSVLCTIVPYTTALLYRAVPCGTVLRYDIVPFCTIIQQPTLHCFHQHMLWLPVLPARPFSTSVTPGISHHPHPEGELRMIYMPDSPSNAYFVPYTAANLITSNKCKYVRMHIYSHIFIKSLSSKDVRFFPPH